MMQATQRQGSVMAWRDGVGSEVRGDSGGRGHMYALVYCIGVFLSDLLHSV